MTNLLCSTPEDGPQESVSNTTFLMTQVHALTRGSSQYVSLYQSSSFASIAYLKRSSSIGHWWHDESINFGL